MGATIQTTVNFGAYPGVDEVTIAITGQTGVLATSNFQAELRADASASDIHSEDDLMRLKPSLHFFTPQSLVVPGTGYSVKVSSFDGPIWGIIPIFTVWN